MPYLDGSEFLLRVSRHLYCCISKFSVVVQYNTLGSGCKLRPGLKSGSDLRRLRRLYFYFTQSREVGNDLCGLVKVDIRSLDTLELFQVADGLQVQCRATRIFSRQSATHLVFTF